MSLTIPPLPPFQPEWPDFQVWWQLAKSNIENAQAELEDQLAAILAAQAAADAAQTTADAAQIAADAADAAATAAAADATAALATLSDISSDNVLSIVEKKQLVPIVQRIINEKAGIDAQATALGITTEKTNYDTKYTALVTTYLGSLSPAYSDTSAPTTIVRTTFNTRFQDYYDTRQTLLNKIDDVSYVAASAAMTAITDITTDSILDKSEKAQLIQIVNAIIAEKSGLDTQATALSITTEKTTYDTAYTALVTTYLGGLSPAYNDTTQNTTIVRATFNTKFTDYYAAKIALQNKMDSAASTFGVVINPVADVIIYADTAGTVKSGQLPKNVNLSASSGSAVVTTSGTWSRTATTGITCTIGAATGVLAISAMTGSDVYVPVSFTYGTPAVTRTASVHVKRQDDPPSSSGGAGATGGTSASTTSLGDTTGTAYDTTFAVSDTLTVVAGSVGQVACVAPISFARDNVGVNGVTGCFGKWQWRVPAGVWADITSEVQETDTAVENVSGITYGSVSVSHTKTGLGSGTTYEFRFLWRQRNVSGTASAATRMSGTLTATGS